MSQDFPYRHFLKSDQNSQHTSTEIPIPLESNIPQEPKAEESFTQEEIQKINNEIHVSLKNTVTPQKYSAYFEKNFLLEELGIDTIHFSVNTPFIKVMIEDHFIERIEETIFNLLGKKYAINIIIMDNRTSLSSNNSNILKSISTTPSNNHTSSEIKSAKKAKFTLTQTKEDLRLNAESTYIKHMNKNLIHENLIDSSKTFNDFIIGPSNNMAFATAKAVAENPGKRGKYPSLYIYSNSGLGKTHLLHAVANEINDRFPSMVICLTTARDFMKEMIYYIQEKKIGDFQKKYTEKIDILMIDDIHELKGREGTQNEFFHIFNELHARGKQLIFTSDKSPKEIDGIAERIKTRLQWGLVIDIQKPDLETRIAILKKKAKQLDLFLHDDIITLIASSVKTSIRELEGALIKLSAFSDVMRIEIDIEMVRNLLKMDNHTANEVPTLENIAKTTSNYFKIPLANLKSKARKAEITRARHIAMYLSQKIIKSTLKEIGHFYGGRDHTSVIHAIERIKTGLQNDSQLSRDVVAIESNL